jgi:hypothetical protein
VAILILTLPTLAISVDPLQPGKPASSTNGDQAENSPPVLLGDANEDGMVDAADYITLKLNMGRVVYGLALDGDFDGSGTVDVNDLQILAAGICPADEIPPATVPEPLTMCLFALGMVVAARRLRGRLSIPQ